MQQLVQCRQCIHRRKAKSVQSRQCFMSWIWRSVNHKSGGRLPFAPLLHFDIGLLQPRLAQMFHQKRHGRRTDMSHGIRRHRPLFWCQIIIVKVTQPFAQLPVLITRFSGSLMPSRETPDSTNCQCQKSEHNFCSDFHKSQFGSVGHYSRPLTAPLPRSRGAENPPAAPRRRGC